MGIKSLFKRKKKDRNSNSSSPPVSPRSLPNYPRSLPESPLRNPFSDDLRSRSISQSDRIKEFEEVFRKFDANSDGKISSSELGYVLSSLGYEASEEELLKMVKEADSDGDGFISLNEFIDFNTKGLDNKVILDDLKDAFSIFDLDKNGSISPEELHTVLTNLGDDSSIAECRKMINGVDCDGDGQIDFEEFKIMMMRQSAPSTPRIED